MTSKQEQLRRVIETFYAQKPVSKSLIEAILYAVNAGGKRLRPLLLLEMLEGFGLSLKLAHYQVAAALELVHTGSLIHDDLPAMDNDDYRRGQLTSHKKFGEATAILAGDSLFLDAFDLLAQADLPAELTVRLTRRLARASGTFGMVGGQSLDILSEGKRLSVAELAVIHNHKTGRLLTFPFVAAGLLAQKNSETLETLEKAGDLVGLAFQVRDDILDVTAAFEELGKTPKKDVLADKSTYPSLLGLKASYAVLSDSLNQAQAIFGELAEKEHFKARVILEHLERLRLYG